MNSNVSFGMKWLVGTAFTAIALLASTGAEAAELNTALIHSGFSTFVDYRCRLTNLGTEPIAVTLTMFDSNGTLVNFPAEGFATPGVTILSTVLGENAASVRCQASGQFPKKKVSLTLQLIDTGSGITQVVVPGQ